MSKGSPYDRGRLLGKKLRLLDDAELCDFIEGCTSRLSNDAFVHLFNSVSKQVADRLATAGWLSDDVENHCAACKWLRYCDEVAEVLAKQAVSNG